MLKISNLALTAAISLLIVPAGIAQASVLNSSFETGDFTDWDTIQYCSVKDLYFLVRQAGSRENGAGRGVFGFLPSTLLPAPMRSQLC